MVRLFIGRSNMRQLFNIRRTLLFNDALSHHLSMACWSHKMSMGTCQAYG